MRPARCPIRSSSTWRTAPCCARPAGRSSRTENGTLIMQASQGVGQGVTGDQVSPLSIYAYVKQIAVTTPTAYQAYVTTMNNVRTSDGISGFTLTSGGSGYTSAPSVTISGGGGTGRPEAP